MNTASAKEIEAGLPGRVRKQLAELTKAFLEENAKMNLSAHRTKEAVWMGNVMDSLSSIQALKQFSIFNSQFSILDLGTGGGFPLLPLAITLPEHRFTGLDSVRKKMDAVEHIVNTMKLPNITLITGRAEELGHDPSHRENYDIVTARAVAETSILLEYCAPFLKVGGLILLWKSMNIAEEISSASRAESTLHLHKKIPIIYDLGDDWPASRSPPKADKGWGKRQILIYEKTKSTSEEYPRPVGAAKKHPL